MLQKCVLQLHISDTNQTTSVQTQKPATGSQLLATIFIWCMRAQIASLRVVPNLGPVPCIWRSALFMNMATHKVPINTSTFEELAAVPEVGPATAGLIVGLRMASKGITPEMFKLIPDLKDSVSADLFDFYPYASHKGKTPTSPRPGQVSPPRASQSPSRTSPETGPFFTRTPVAQARRASVRAAHAVPYRIPPEEPYPLEYPADTITFSGKGSWSAFHMKFTAFADERYWSARQRTHHLCMCLEGKASAFYTMLVHRNPEIEYYDIVHQLQRRFDSREPPEAVQLAFASARQLPDESVADWADRVADLAHRAFQELSDDCRQRQTVLKFCQGCLDKEAGLYAMNTQPIVSSIDQALDLVRWYRHTRKAMYGRSRLDVRSTSVRFTDVSHSSCGFASVHRTWTRGLQSRPGVHGRVQNPFKSPGTPLLPTYIGRLYTSADRSPRGSLCTSGGRGQLVHFAQIHGAPDRSGAEALYSGFGWGLISRSYTPN